MDIYQIQTRTIQGEPLDWTKYKGKVLLIVNTASECGLKGQLGDLQQLYSEFQSTGLEVLAVPSADFLGQEPKEGEELAKHCSIQYRSTYQFLEKGHVKKSPKHPIFKFLTEKEENGKISGNPWWNFEKYLIGKNGEVVRKFKPWVNPNGGKVRRAIEEELRK